MQRFVKSRCTRTHFSCKEQENVKVLLGLNPGSQPVAVPAAGIVRGNNKVFVVYGHDEPARTQLEAMLRRWGMEPLILDQLPSEGQTIIEKLNAAETPLAML